MPAPLRAMQGFTEMLAESCAACPQPDTQRFLQRIQTAAGRMDSILLNALNYSRAVRQQLPLETIDVGALLRGMLDSYPEFQAAKARIENPGHLPPVLGNQAGLPQCFSNLLGNALKFVKPGQIPHVRIWAELVIGLALVRKVMDRMGGKVAVESAEGKGSRFWLDLQPTP